MNTRIVFAILVSLIIFWVYSSMTASVDGFDVNSQSYEVFVPPAPTAPPAQEKVVMPSGPSSPSQQAPKESIRMPEEEPYDPQNKDYETPDHPDRLRYPERAFGPGLMAEETLPAISSGVANNNQATMNAYQNFGPEFAQNGGSFLDGVVANDAFVETSYSSI